MQKRRRKRKQKEKAKTEIRRRRRPEGTTRQERQRNRSLREKRTTSRRRWKGGQESSQVQQKKVDIASMGGGTEMEWLVSISFTLWSRKIEPVPKLPRWNVNCWSSARLERQ